jgi:hypothetical protein
MTHEHYVSRHNLTNRVPSSVKEWTCQPAKRKERKWQQSTGNKCMVSVEKLAVQRKEGKEMNHNLQSGYTGRVKYQIVHTANAALGPGYHMGEV